VHNNVAYNSNSAEDIEADFSFEEGPRIVAPPLPAPSIALSPIREVSITLKNSEEPDVHLRPERLNIIDSKATRVLDIEVKGRVPAAILYGAGSVDQSYSLGQFGGLELGCYVLYKINPTGMRSLPQEYSLWWDAESEILNRSNRHILDSTHPWFNEDGNDLSFTVIASDIEGNMPLPDARRILGTSELQRGQLHDLIQVPGTQTIELTLQPCGTLTLNFTCRIAPPNLSIPQSIASVTSLSSVSRGNPMNTSVILESTESLPWLRQYDALNHFDELNDGINDNHMNYSPPLVENAANMLSNMSIHICLEQVMNLVLRHDQETHSRLFFSVCLISADQNTLVSYYFIYCYL
jgi:hypothetical protein